MGKVVDRHRADLFVPLVLLLAVLSAFVLLRPPLLLLLHYGFGIAPDVEQSAVPWPDDFAESLDPQPITPPSSPASLVSTTAPQRWTIPVQVSATMDSLADGIFTLTNGERLPRSLSKLQPEPQLADIAVRHSQDMLDRAYLSHDSPDGDGPSQRAATLHRTLFGLTSENIAEYSSGSVATEALAAEFNTMWMESPGHRRNILRADSTHLGVGCAEGADSMLSGNLMRKCTQLFTNAYAYADDPIPAELAVGSQLSLSLRASSGKQLPSAIVQIDLSTDRPVTPGGPAQLTPMGDRAKGQLDLVGPPGLYGLSIHVSRTDSSRGYWVIPGPFVRVR